MISFVGKLLSNLCALCVDLMVFFPGKHLNVIFVCNISL